MSRRKYKDIRFQAKSLDTIDKVNSIVAEYEAQGYELTLRQVYYQLVARGFIPNNERSYKNLGNLINDGRLAGLIDWYAIVDRTRNLRGNSHWDRPEDVIDSARYSYMLDRWENQPNYVEVWVEKDALIGIVSQICRELDVIIHLGDHDPSGIDMTRDIQERMDMFGADVFVKRVALTMEQIETFCPPPNPTKLSDARASGYIREYGHECWELDALEPKVITSLIRNEVTALLDTDLLSEIERREKTDKTNIKLISEHYGAVVDFLRNEVV